MIKTYSFSSEKRGKRLLILGAVHGNETCGPIAIGKLIAGLNTGAIRLERGSLTCVPVCNERAYSKNIRMTEDNLNRVFRHHDEPDSYEKQLANELVPLFADADYVLDLHSMPSGHDAYAFADKTTPEVLGLSEATGVPYIMTGWPELFENTGDSSAGEYAISLGKIAVSVECGQHGTEESTHVAYGAIINVLKYLKIIDPPSLHYGAASGASETGGPAFAKASGGKQKTIAMTDRIIYDGGKFAKHWANFDVLRAGDLIGWRGDGSEVRAERDAVMIIPNLDDDIQVGHEWYYLGKFQTAI